MHSFFSINDEAYKTKYSYSLEEIWDKLPEDQKESHLKEARNNIGAAIPKEYTFGTDEILRILIGYINREQLKSVLCGSSHITRVLLWEPDEAVFAAGCILEDLTELIKDNRIVIALGSNENILKDALSKSAFENNILHRHVYAYGKYLQEDNKDVETFIRVFEQYYVDLASRMKFRKQYEHLVYENMLYAVNTLSNNTTADRLFKSIPVRDIPVIIVAAGPSLMKNCRELTRAKGRAIIVAVAHSVKTLAKNGIQPDIVAVIDPESPFFLDFDKERDSALLCCVYADRTFQEAYNGKLVYFGFSMYKEFFSSKYCEVETKADIDTGSVATEVLSLFSAAGFKRFILVGQDLAFDSDGMSHTEGEREVTEKEILIETEGINGDTVKTRVDWQLFRHYYERKIQQDSSLDIIDATEGGALIHGSKVMRLRDAIDEYCIKAFPIENWIKNTLNGLENEKEYIDAWFEHHDQMNEKTMVNLDRIISLNEDIISLWNDKESWDDDFSAKCKRYDIIYHIVMEGDDAAPIREYSRADIERYIEDAFTYEGDDNIEARMKREHELFCLLRKKLMVMQDYIRTIRCGK